MKSCKRSLSRFSSLLLWVLLCEVPDVNARSITTTQVLKAAPVDFMLEHDYRVTANDKTISTSIQRWFDTVPPWMDDGCANLEQSGDNWLLESITYNPARVNPSNPYFVESIFVYPQHFCHGVAFVVHLEDMTNIHTECDGQGARPWEDPRNRKVREESQNIPGLGVMVDAAGDPVTLDFHLDIPAVLPEKDVPESLRAPLREEYTDEEEFEKETAIRWHRASAWRGKQHIADIAAWETEANKPDQFELEDTVTYDDSWSNQVGVFTRNLTGCEFWGPVSIKIVSDYSKEYTTDLGRETV
ncbi:hypothetical protein TWF730_003823 [Orbilia blumenaviensis]|uniref:Uncharacterized protein n=1 Tax=Orbilia blumenaviensis TaxID=1796055 RepID=A0AAV9U186_9PEZI